MGDAAAAVAIIIRFDAYDSVYSIISSDLYVMSAWNCHAYIYSGGTEFSHVAHIHFILGKKVSCPLLVCLVSSMVYNFSITHQKPFETAACTHAYQILLNIAQFLSKQYSG